MFVLASAWLYTQVSGEPMGDVEGNGGPDGIRKTGPPFQLGEQKNKQNLHPILWDVA